MECSHKNEVSCSSVAPVIPNSEPGAWAQGILCLLVDYYPGFLRRRTGVNSSDKGGLFSVAGWPTNPERPPLGPVAPPQQLEQKAHYDCAQDQVPYYCGPHKEHFSIPDLGKSDMGAWSPSVLQLAKHP